MRSKAYDIALIGVYTALLLGAQYVLSFVAGVELVTVMVAAFCYKFGWRRGAALVNLFSLLRCVIYGFFPTVVVLYVVYYNLFAVVFALIGRVQGRKLTALRHAVVITAAVVMTALFTLLDDVITPLMYGYTYKMAQAYFIASLYIMLAQCICAFATVLLLFRPIVSVFDTAYGRRERDIAKTRILEDRV